MDLGEYVEINLDDKGNVIPNNKDKTLIIDGDTVVFTSCLRGQEQVELLPRNFYTDEEWQDIIDNPSYNPEKSYYYEADFKAITNLINEKLNRIKFFSGCNNFIMYLTEGKQSFRYNIYKDYKANRKKLETPMYLAEAKEYCVKQLKAIACKDYEADDAVIAKKKELGNKGILCAVDKDVLNAIEGVHFNYYESVNYDKSMHFTEPITAKEARLWPYKQCIMGDISDNIIGIKGIGPKKADKLFANAKEENWWDIVKAAYKQAGRTTEEALLNFRLVSMNQLVNGKIKLIEEKDL